MQTTHAAYVRALAARHKEAADRVRSRVTDYLVAQTELSKYPEEGFDQILATTDVIPTFVSSLHLPDRPLPAADSAAASRGRTT